MGEVWRAEHRLLARQAAIKLIRPEALRDPTVVAEIRERFRREAQTLASMQSRHTIEIFDYGVTDDGTFFYVMELLDGLDLESLDRALRRAARGARDPACSRRRVSRSPRRTTPACSTATSSRRTCSLCRAADEVDIIKLLDFGIVQTRQRDAPMQAGRARRRSRSLETPKLTQLGAMLGTPGFMAPEQILGMQLDGRADLYALGCVAWWLLAGGEVFSRDDGEAKVLHKHIYDELPVAARRSCAAGCRAELESRARQVPREGRRRIAPPTRAHSPRSCARSRSPTSTRGRDDARRCLVAPRTARRSPRRRCRRPRSR